MFSIIDRYNRISHTMPAISAYAPGKIILFGEHAVVYGRPAIAAPVKDVQARAMVKAEPRLPSGTVQIQAPDIGLQASLDQLEPHHPLAMAVHLTFNALKVKRIPALTLRITSTIPTASGLGSGAAVSVASIRALSAFFGQPMPDEKVCELAFEIEKIHHGTPSGIDNTVIAFGKPVYFVKGKAPQTFHVARPFTIVIGDTGIASPTAASVGDVRKSWKARRDHYEALFDSAGAITEAARQSIESGMIETLGPLMDANHGVLQKMGVSCPELDRLATAARRAGAWGAKLSGGGRGGNMIALASPQTAEKIASALKEAGAANVLQTVVK
jgi:mevalonate kinase